MLWDCQYCGTKKLLEGCLEEVAAGGMGLEASDFTDPSRIEEYLENPPPEDWDGVYVFTHK